MRRILILTAALLAAMPALARLEKVNDYYYKVWRDGGESDETILANITDALKSAISTTDKFIRLEIHTNITISKESEARKYLDGKDASSSEGLLYQHGGAIWLEAAIKDGATGQGWKDRYEVVLDGESTVRCLYLNNAYAKDDAIGGAATAGLNEKLSNSHFVGITFANGNSTGYGGGVYCNDNACFLHCKFTNCKATTGAGAILYPADDQYYDEILYLDTGDSCKNDSGVAVGDCEFENCTTDGTGGALYGGVQRAICRTVSDCTFSNCEAAYGGAICNWNSDWGLIYKMFDGGQFAYSFDIGMIRRCRFQSCTAQYGGAIEIGYHIIACLFRDCTATAQGGAIRSGSGSGFDTRAYCCTFINCTDPNGDCAYDNTGMADCIIYNCIIYGSGTGNTDNGASCVVITEKNYFMSTEGDGNYRFNPDYGKPPYTIDVNQPSDPWDFSNVYNVGFRDIDCRPYAATTSDYRLKGCYSYYTKAEWEEFEYNHKPFEYDAGCDPLLVTTTGESANNKDGIVSFREALTYFGDAAIRAKSTHQERIDFQLAGNRTITLMGEMVNVAWTGIPLTINGGDNGITLEHESNPEWAIRFNGDSSDIRTFQNVTVKLGIFADYGGAEVGFRFINCNFVGGDTPFASGRVGTWVGWDRYDIEWRFERCTFAGYKAGDYILAMGEYKTTATFDACTFTGNSPEKALIRGAGKAVYFRNCTFFDNSVRTMSSATRPNPTDPDPPYPSENYFNCIICQSDCSPSASSSDNAISDTPGDVFNSAVPVEKTVNGVVQVGFEPKHKGTSRGGSWGYGDWRTVPERDIFMNGKTDRYISQGSWYKEDKEDPSLLVNDPGDETDAYDDKITLREALTYAADPANKRIIVGTTVRPTFDKSIFPDGNVVLTLDHGISFFEDIYAVYPCELQPGDDQTLTITAPNSPDGAFRIGEKMKMRVKDTTIKSCKSEGVGGAISSYGQILIDGCRFEDCQANMSSGSGGALFLGENGQAFIHGTTFTRCKAFIGGAIGNMGDLVAICVTLTGNEAVIGSAVNCSHEAGLGRTLFANATIASNTANGSNGAFCADGANAGLINSIVAGNQGGNVWGNWSPAPSVSSKPQTGNFYAYSLTDGTLSDIFATANAIPTNMPNGVEQLYYPLSSTSKAKNGAFVFTKGGLDTHGVVVAAPWIEKVGYSTNIDGFDPYPRELNGLEMKDFNGYAMKDLTGGLIMPEDTGMGAMPSFARDVIDSSSLVNILDDVVSDIDGKVSLREAVDYAMAHGGQVNFDPSIFDGAEPVFTLENQIVVAEDCSFELKAPSGHRLTLLATGKNGNRFFRVENGGALKLEGVTMGSGTAHGDYGLMALEPQNDSNGGAICGAGKKSDLTFTDCAFFDNTAPKGFGGAIYAEGRLALTDCIFMGNSAGYDGGAVYSKAAMMTMTGGEVTDNSAKGNGGGIGIGVENSTNIVNGVEITGNVAGKAGGGIYSGDGDSLGCVLLQDVKATGNHADATLSDDQNVFAGAGYTFNERYVLRVNRKYYEVKKDENGVERIELSDEAIPVVGEVKLSSVVSTGKATIKVTNIIPNLEYGLGHAENPVGPYTVDNWVRATDDGDLSLEAPANGSGGFYRVMAREWK